MSSEITGDIELLRESAAGSREAFGAVVRRYQALVCAVTYSATGDVAASEDLAQETFIRAWKNLKQLENPSKFRAWLCTIARNVARTWGRSSGGTIASTRPIEAAAELPANTPGPDQATLAKERQEIVWAAVERVPEEYREPLVLFYRKQQSVSDVAADLGLTEEAVRQRLHRGRQLIKAEVSSLVEQTLARSGPGNAFAVAVVAALPAVMAAPASAAMTAGAAATATGAGKTIGAGGLGAAILAPVLALPGGIVGVWWASKLSGSPQQRRFMMRLTGAWWLAFLGLIAMPLALQLEGLISARSLAFSVAAFFVVFLVLIIWSVAGTRGTRLDEGTRDDGRPWPARVARKALYAAFGGAIWGGSAPFLYRAWVAKDWGQFGAALACAAVVLLVVTRLWVRKFGPAVR